MPKVNEIQTSFHGGEFSPLLEGQVHADRFKTGLRTCLNYYPLLQGPLIRRPGTKYVTNAKQSAAPPALIPFVFSQTQAYVLEFGERYIRFFTNSGQLLTSSNSFRVQGYHNTAFEVSAVRTDPAGAFGETVLYSSVITAGSILEVVSPYLQTDVAQIKFSQNADTLYLTHPSYPVYKLQRKGSTLWDLKQVYFKDGPFLPLNSYQTLADSPSVKLFPSSTGVGTLSASKSIEKLLVGGVTSTGSNIIRVSTTTNHGFSTGDKVFIKGVVGTTEANNSAYGTWTVDVSGVNSIDLRNSVFQNVYVGSGTVYYALFQSDSTPNPYDTWITGTSATTYSGRVIGLINGGTRYWGEITGVSNPGQAIFRMNDDASTGSGLPDSSAITFWQFGVYSRLNGFPSTTCFHQDRLGFAGATSVPQELDFSMTGDYERFAATGSNITVIADNNAWSYKLQSEQLNKIMWVKSAAQGLLAGSLSTEWTVAPNSQSQGLTPTNVSATATSFFGSADVDAVQSGNATLYVQRSQRKIREMNFFFQVGTFRSTDLTEIAEHITIPTVTKLAVQKETFPLVWGVRSDGNLASMSYNRDDQTIKAGWSRHILGGQSDSGGTNPVVKSIATIPATVNSTVFDQLWLVVQRSTLAGSTYTSIEYLTKPFDDSILQEDAFQGDCGATYDTPVVISGISSASSAIVSGSSHGFSNGDAIRIVSVVGLNSSVIDSYGNITITNLVNEKTFTVGSALTHTFALLNYGSSATNSLGYSAYVSGGQVRKMVQTISGLGWLAGDTVGVLADGANHPDVVVQQSGVILLNYRAAKVQIGYRYNSDGQCLRQDGGSAQGTSIGETSRIHRVAPMFHKVGDFSMGGSFTDLVPMQFQQADIQQADQATPLYSGIQRDSIGAGYDFDGFVCWRQNSMLPGAVLSITYFSEVQDV